LLTYGYEALPIKRYNFQFKNNMTKREEIKNRYKSGNDFIADVSKRTMLILEELESFLDDNEPDLFDDDIPVSDYFSVMSLKDKLDDLVKENA
jgi:hypothetical protein